MSIDWRPICQFVNDPPILTDGKCSYCLQDPFVFDTYFVCPQCGTKWSSPGYEPVGYAYWSDDDASGLPVKDKRRRGLGIYR